MRPNRHDLGSELKWAEAESLTHFPTQPSRAPLPPRCVVFDDSAEGCYAARAAGMRVVRSCGVRQGPGPFIDEGAA